MHHYWVAMLQPQTLLHANINGEDQPVHPRSLISAFDIRYVECIVVKLAPSKFSIFLLVAVTEQVGLSLT